MIPSMSTFNDWLPVIFVLVMGVAMLVYVILDGYNLGVGILLRFANQTERDTMISSIGPFWDANETWLVLGVGIMLICFPTANGIILGQLYLPVATMLIGLILRGVAFDFRVKAQSGSRQWDKAFFAGSLITTISQGIVLGLYIQGFNDSWETYLFAIVVALGLTSGYVLIGSAWLILKTEGALQQKAITWGLKSLGVTGIGIASISLATPWASPTIFAKWFQLPFVVLLLPIPLATLLLFFITWRSLVRLPTRIATNNHYGEWVPFASVVGIFFLSFYGLAYSLFPYIIMDRITIWEAASAPESLIVILIGALVVLPLIVVYTIYSYRVFGGKTQGLSYSGE